MTQLFFCFFVNRLDEYETSLEIIHPEVTKALRLKPNDDFLKNYSDSLCRPTCSTLDYSPGYLLDSAAKKKKYLKLPYLIFEIHSGNLCCMQPHTGRHRKLAALQILLAIHYRVM